MSPSKAARLAILGLVATISSAFPLSALADGEAGLVIQDGENVRTYCVAFAGESISGDQLLQSAGQPFDAYGGGSGLALCSLAGKGCDDAHSFSSCFCQCQGGDCTYWAFFTRAYGKNWVYSSLAFNLLKAKDGEVHGWKWGAGSPNSAPAPKDVSFEQVCGHSPRGGAAPATPTASPVVVAVSPAPPAQVPRPPIGAPGTSAASTSTMPPGASPSALVTIPGSASVPQPTEAGPTAVVSGAQAASDGSSGGTLLAFATVVAVLAAAIVAAAIWRARRG